MIYTALLVSALTSVLMTKALNSTILPSRKRQLSQYENQPPFRLRFKRHNVPAHRTQIAFVCDQQPIFFLVQRVC